MLQIHIYPEKKKKIKKYTFQNYPPCHKKLAFPYIQSYTQLDGLEDSTQINNQHKRAIQGHTNN